MMLDGKWPRALGNVLVVEMSEVRRIMIEQIDRLAQNFDRVAL